jgi:hypothetical protein
VGNKGVRPSDGLMEQRWRHGGALSVGIWEMGPGFLAAG